MGIERVRALSNIFESPVLLKPSLSELLLWAKSSSYSMFIVPPEDKEFDSFRFLTKKAVWGRVPDINQLAYSPKFYMQGMERLNKLGFTSFGPHRFAFKYDLCFLSLQKEMISLPVVIYADKKSCIESYLILFQNKDFLVVRKK